MFCLKIVRVRTDPPILIQAVNLLHIIRGQLKIKQIRIAFDPFFSNGLWNGGDSVLANPSAE